MALTSTPISSAHVRGLADVSLADAAEVGGKAANLGVLVSAGLPVPPGFVITADAYLDAMEAAGVRRALTDPDHDDPARARALVEGAGIPEHIREEILRAYRLLGDSVSVAVRSSAPAEDAADNSFAGIHESFVDVTGEEELVRAVTGCWVSLWTARAVEYRTERRIVDEPSIAVVVQQLVASDRSGVVFTADPRTGEADRLVVEASYGLGETVVGGQVEPDSYIVAKDGHITVSHLGTKAREVVAAGDHGAVEVTSARREAAVLDEAEVHEVCELAQQIEALQGAPQDIEFAFEGPRLWILQSRPITTLGTEPRPERAPSAGAGPDGAPGRERVLVEGLAAGPGVATGRVRILRSPAECQKLVDGEVLVASLTDPDWLPALSRAAAIVTDGGGITCHAAIVGRELGRPVVVATRVATTTLVDGQLITVDGSRGVVLDGAPAARVEPPRAAATVPAGAPTVPEVTATAVYVNLATPEQAERVAALPVDGVGLLRAEFLVGEALDGVHPSLVLREGRRDEYVARMAEGVSRIAAAFGSRPVVYRALDLRSNELRALRGGDGEPDERNPMIGYRGCFRYVKDPELFRLDLDVLAEVRRRHTNVHLMIPFVRTHWELEACLELLDDHRLGRDRSMLRWIMAEVPSVAYWLPRYAQLGIDGISIGTNDLTQLVLGVDRDSEICSELFDTMDPAVLDAVERIVENAQLSGLTTSICGQAVSDHPALAERLVNLGIDSVSVNPDVAVAARGTVARAERRILLGQARG